MRISWLLLIQLIECEVLSTEKSWPAGSTIVHMDNKYNIPKKKKPETKQEIIAQQIEELVARRDKSSNAGEKQKINAEITTLFAQYERLKI